VGWGGGGGVWGGGGGGGARGESWRGRSEKAKKRGGGKGGGQAMCDMAVFVLLHRTDELVGYPSTHSINSGCHPPLEHGNCHHVYCIYTLKHFYIAFFCTVFLTFVPYFLQLFFP